MREWTTIQGYEDILFQQYGGIAKITINRPQVYNAFRPKTNEEMLDAMAICRERADIRSDSAHRCRRQGILLRRRPEGERNRWVYRRQWSAASQCNIDLHKAIRSIPKPVIAMVNGYAAGGGHVLHVVCDLTIASENARFGQTGRRWAVSTPASAQATWLVA